MTRDEAQVSPWAYALGGLSFIPLLGVAFGLGAVCWGLATRRTGGRIVAVMGACGIASTAAMYFVATSFFSSSFVDSAREEIAADHLNVLLNAIEVHKLQTGQYPKSLAELAKELPSSSPFLEFDPLSVDMGLVPRQMPRPFYYELADAYHYYLRSVGRDGTPFTPDDILPNVNVAPDSPLGFLKDKK